MLCVNLDIISSCTAEEQCTSGRLVLYIIDGVEDITYVLTQRRPLPSYLPRDAEAGKIAPALNKDDGLPDHEAFGCSYPLVQNMSGHYSFILSLEILI